MKFNIGEECPQLLNGINVMSITIANNKESPRVITNPTNSVLGMARRPKNKNIHSVHGICPQRTVFMKAQVNGGTPGAILAQPIFVKTQTAASKLQQITATTTQNTVKPKKTRSSLPEQALQSAAPKNFSPQKATSLFFTPLHSNIFLIPSYYNVSL
jgi:hypothetical protein